MSQQSESQDIEAATTAIEETLVPGQPDNKTRRYDRQLRLWAASGQTALETARVLVIGSSATSSSTLKNLVLPGVGHYTILDDGKATEADIGNNFFLEQESLGKSRAVECVRLLGEMNESVDGSAKVESIETIITHEPDYVLSFNLIIVHNLNPILTSKLSSLLSAASHPVPTLIVIRSAGFLAEVFIQFREQAIIESHGETAPSLRIDKPFPALLQHAQSLDFDSMDTTEHGHIPYVVILVHVMLKWKAAHDGQPPKTPDDKAQFKSLIRNMVKKADEENFEEAIGQTYRAWTETTVPYEIRTLFEDSSVLLNDPASMKASPNVQFYRMLWTLREFARTEPHTLPLTLTLPDMKADTQNYIYLQKLYKGQADEERKRFIQLLDLCPVPAPPDCADGSGVVEFVKNAHALRLLKGEPWGALDKDLNRLASSLQENPKGTAIHLALSALDVIRSGLPFGADYTRAAHVEALRSEVQKLTNIPLKDLPEEIETMIGEVARAPTAELPTAAAFLGGLVAQEAIKMITKQYVPIKGYCVVDLISSETIVLNA